MNAQIDVRSVLADFGAKSPLDLRVADSTIIHPGSTDTVQIEVTNLMQVWALDATHPTILVLRPRYPVQSFGEIHFYPSRAQALRPALPAANPRPSLVQRRMRVAMRHLRVSPPPTHHACRPPHG